MPSPPAILSIAVPPRKGQATSSPRTPLEFDRRQSLHPSIISRFGAGFIFSTVDTVAREDRFK
jgi:hypothetical protein